MVRFSKPARLEITISNQVTACQLDFSVLYAILLTLPEAPWDNQLKYRLCKLLLLLRLKDIK